VHFPRAFGDSLDGALCAWVGHLTATAQCVEDAVALVRRVIEFASAPYPVMYTIDPVDTWVPFIVRTVAAFGVRLGKVVKEVQSFLNGLSLQEAEIVLASIPDDVRDADWETFCGEEVASPIRQLIARGMDAM
jgi:hypothetical protein